MNDVSNSLAIRSLADRLIAAETDRSACPPIREEIAALSVGDAVSAAYAVQNEVNRRRSDAGERIVGRKIGLTSKAVQKQLGVDSPDFGTLFAAMAIGDGAEISLGGLIQPKVEAEIAFILGRDLTFERNTTADILRAVDYAVAAIEVVDSRIARWDIRLLDTVADNGSSARFVLGTRPLSLGAVDLFNCTMSLDRAGQEVSKGAGAACLGNPVNAACWLADMMVAIGTPLRAGDVVMTGALGPMAVVTEPGTYTANIEGFGSVRAVFTA
ncbi:fumarylacetoacetate hydrolase family protein [Kaistia dalseonensis]|uniref:2-keto-4-pentenoate hydratase n=1 Tax=Kaistia dalseonensis TaxID=410840 RepID=A0ABU0H734_9HYPH|nr:fumarylacetoacetate hydrolase family protein [Kaistia dalseonensis]MCX5495533.1 fumarylacetoacetate hydrolase family protein [Kaistia dalseonensis]MDQ0438125.1 2-keto-4-pentenoate hydratase [Kaistia dalseonensis]